MSTTPRAVVAHGLERLLPTYARADVVLVAADEYEKFLETVE